MALRLSVAIVGLMAALAAAPGARAQVSEVELKAAFVYNFALFTAWPREKLPAGRPLSICAMTAAAQVDALRQLRGRTVAGHTVSVSAAPGTSACHVVVYQPDASPPPAAAGALTVCDGPAQACHDAVITLVREGDRIRFDVDSARARAKGLGLSSKLLRLARHVR
jgi:ABC-type amino acid transport substrate-binding protein